MVIILELRRMNMQKINLEDAFNYIESNTPKNKKNEKAKDIMDDNHNQIKREYTVIDTGGIINEFILDLIDDSIYLTHIFKNPNTELELDEDEETSYVKKNNYEEINEDDDDDEDFGDDILY